MENSTSNPSYGESNKAEMKALFGLLFLADPLSSTAMETLPQHNASGSTRGKPRQSRGRRLYQRGRVATMRQEKGAVTMSNLQEEIRRKMFVGTSEDDALARLSEQQTLKAITLSITTRGIGLGICHLTFISISYHENIHVPSCYSMYRVFLGLLEAKLEAIKSDLPVVPRLVEHMKQPGVNSDMLRAAHLRRKYTFPPSPLIPLRQRFSFLINNLRFDDSSTRTARATIDRLAPIRDVFDIFVKNCQNAYTPHEYLTIDEELVAFRRRCIFRQ
uniref:SFRICE_022105 n=1 Tax=Spodoptera frugiperda TaxID=7108 RepID=A0A2H1VUC8_SPOFR